MMRVFVLPTLALSLFASPVLAQPVPDLTPPASQPADSGAPAQKLRETIIHDTLGAWWGGILVFKDGQPLVKYTSGFRDATGRPIDENTLFDVGDISMQFTCVALLKLEQDGKISLEDPVSKYFQDAGPSADRITIRHLMGHTSGLVDSAPLPQGLDTFDRDATAHAVLTSQPASEPGAAWNYCRRGYSVLAAVIEKASGKPFERYMREDIFAKLGMTRTGFADGAGLDDDNTALRVSTGRVAASGRRPLFVGPEGWSWAGRGSAGVITCLNDAVRWERAMFSDELLSAPQRAKLAELQKDYWALGAYVTTTHRNTRRMWVGGASPGLIAVSFRFIDEGTSIFVISNEKGDPDLIAFSLSDVLFPPLPEHFQGELLLGELATKVDRQLHPGRPSFRASRTGTDIQVEVLAPQGHPLARLVLSEGLARRTAAALKDAIRVTADKEIPPPSTTLDPRYLGVRTDGRCFFSSEARLEVRAMLRGQDPEGKEVREDLPVLAVIDPKAKGWPLLVRMDQPSSKQLYETLTSAINQ